MSSRKTEILDDDGNVLAPPPPDSDVAQVIYLLEYARKRGFQIGPSLKVGSVELDVRDARQHAQAMRDAAGGSTTEIQPGSAFAALLGDE